MQPELPWNVAGIAPEAREAARASARREGLSVGEWLTRRILRSLTEGAAPPDDWWSTVASTSRHIAEKRPPAPENSDMLARLSRSESESNTSWRTAEEQVSGLARRLEQTERSQSENSRAAHQAAMEVNIATREQAQALDQLGRHVMGLDDRMRKLEQHAEADGSREAVKILHQGLSRLADQVADTAKRSAEQAAQLATSIESVAARLAECRDEGQQSWHSLEDRVGTLAANVGAIAGKLVESRDDIERQARELSARLAASEQTIERIELAQTARAGENADSQRQARDLCARLAASEQEIERIELAQTARGNEDGESRRHTSAMSQLTESLEMLTRRFVASEAQLSGSLARLEDQVSRIDTQAGEAAITARLQTIERTLTGMADRIERGERDSMRASDAIEDELRNLGLRLDTTDRRQSEALAELAALANEAGERFHAEPPEAPTAAATVAPAPAPQPAAVPTFDLPPFVEETTAAFPPAAAPDTSSPAPTSAAPESSVHNGETAAFSAAAFTPAAGSDAAAAGAESYLDAARRSALAASQAEQAQRGKVFSWVDPPAAPDRAERNRIRLFLLIGLGTLVVIAIAASLFLSAQRTAAPPPPPAAVAAPSKPPAAAPAVQSTLPAATAPAPIAPPFTAPSQANHTNPAPQQRAHRLKPVRARSASAQVRMTPPSRMSAAPTRPVVPMSPQARLVGLANAGNAKAQEFLGLQYLDGDGVQVNEAEGAKWLQRAALQGEAVAAYRLGTLFERGHGVPADAAKAAQWYAVAAKAGNRKAMHNLAVAYAQGTGVQKDLTAAAQWFTRAATLGLADSQFNLAVLYERGMGVPQSLADAYKWYAIAAAQGDAESKARIQVLDSQIGAEDKAAAQKAAADFHPAPLDHAANVPPDMASVAGG